MEWCRAPEPGVGHAHREAPHPGRHRARLRHLGLIGHIAHHGEHERGVDAVGHECPGAGRQAFGCATGQHYGSAIAGEVAGDSEPDTAATAGDEGTLPHERGGW